MARNKTTKGGSFSDSTVDNVWKKGTLVSGTGDSQIRKDKCGAKMRRGDYGDTSSTQGWEIDHIKPVAKGGGDEESNLQPLQWENNRGKADDHPNWSCSVTS